MMNFQVELTSFCDLTCGYCPNRDMKRKRSFMADDVFERILQSYIVPYRHVNMFCPPTFIAHKDGEPLLNKKLPAVLTRLSEVVPDMKVDVYSHGLMLPVWLDRGYDFIDFLGRLPNRSRYLMSYHPRNHDDSANDYAPVVEYLKRKLKDPPPNVEFITVSHKSRWVTPDMQERWRSTWQDEVDRRVLTVHCNCSINPWTGLIDEEGMAQFNGCPYGDFGHWFFGATGNVIACCLDLEEEIVLGNVMRDDPAEMFRVTSEFYALQRRTQEEKLAVAHQVCANCFGQVRGDLVQLGTKV